MLWVSTVVILADVTGKSFANAVNVTATALTCNRSMLHVNSLAPRIFHWNFRLVIFKLNLVIDGWGISDEITLRWMSLDLTGDKSALIQVMAWCCQATRHYLSQCWPTSLSPYGVTRPQCVNLLFFFNIISPIKWNINRLRLWYPGWNHDMATLWALVALCARNPLNSGHWRIPGTRGQ